MTRWHSLSETDEYVAIFDQNFQDTLTSDQLGDHQRVRVLKEIRNTISHVDPARPPHEHTESVEGVDEVEKLYVTDRIRIWCRAVRDLSKYEVLFVFDIDPSHQYNRNELVEVDANVKETLRQVGQVPAQQTATEYLAQYNLFDEDDVQALIDNIES